MRYLFMLVISFLVFQYSGAQQDSIPTITSLKAHGITINVTNVDKAIEFYVNRLGFEFLDKAGYPNWVELRMNGNTGKLYLHLVNNIIAEKETDAKANLTLQVNDFDSAYHALKSKGIDFGNHVKRKEGVGYAIYFTDPFGTRLSLMQVTVLKEPRFDEPRIYNYGIQIPDMTKARSFFTRLGFIERSKRYLPLDMPLGNPDKSFGFMLHERDGVEAIHYNTANDEHIVILLRTNDLKDAILQMKSADIAFLQKSNRKNYLGNSISFRDTFGLVYELVEVKE